MKRTISEEHKKRISEANKGRIFSEESRKRMSESQKKRKVTTAQLERLKRNSEEKIKPVEQYDQQGDFVARFQSSDEAAKAMGVHVSSIRLSASGKGGTCKNYYWKYVEK